MSVLASIKKKYGDLTGAQKKVADYIYENEDTAAMQTSTQIAQTANVSDTSVIRLAYALGYESYSAMKRDMKQDVLERIATQPKDAQQQNEMCKMLDEEIAILQEMKSGLIRYDQLRGIAKRLLEADRIIIFGYYGEHTVSYQLFLLLDSIRANVFYFRQNNDGYRETAQLTEKSVLIGVSVKPYSNGTLRCIQEMKKYGSYVITFTDSPLSPLAQEANENMTVKVGTDPMTGTNSMAPVMALFHILYTEVVRADQAAAQDYLGRIPSRLVPPNAYKNFIL